MTERCLAWPCLWTIEPHAGTRNCTAGAVEARSRFRFSHDMMHGSTQLSAGIWEQRGILGCTCSEGLISTVCASSTFWEQRGILGCTCSEGLISAVCASSTHVSDASGWQLQQAANLLVFRHYFIYEAYTSTKYTVVWHVYIGVRPCVGLSMGDPYGHLQPSLSLVQNIVLVFQK